MSADPAQELDALRAEWAARGLEALAIWSRFTKLSAPRWCLTEDDERQQHLSGSFAMIRLNDQAVVVSLRQVRELSVEPFAREVLAHEIGHHVYVPGSMLDQGRLLARVRRGLPSREQHAPLVANLYADLLINDRLQRDAGYDMAGVYRALPGNPDNRLWRFYMRAYEILWGLQKGTLAQGLIDNTIEGDAGLAARLVRSYAREWLDGAGRFACLCLLYLLDEPNEGECSGAGRRKGRCSGNAKGGQGRPGPTDGLGGWLDTIGSGGDPGEVPAGLAELDPGELDGIHHPSLDEELSGLDPAEGDRRGPPAMATSPGGGGGQYREPFEYGQILKALGLNLSDHELAVRYYRERAVPQLIPFPTRRVPRAVDPFPEGLDVWDVGEELEKIDWLHSALVSPWFVPGFTTVQRTWGTAEGNEPERRPIDLDLYIDCSGSMPNPQSSTSYLALAGAVVALSALRVRSRVQATLWSGTGQFQTTRGFVSDVNKILQVVTGYLGGGTAFPIHVLRDTFANRKPSDRAAHVLIVSDDGVTTLFDRDERGNSGWDVSREALAKAGAGGTMVLNLPQDWQQYPDLVKAHEQGWQIFRVQTWEDLLGFARAFSRAHYGEEQRNGKRRPVS